MWLKYTVDCGFVISNMNCGDINSRAVRNIPAKEAVTFRKRQIMSVKPDFTICLFAKQKRFIPSVSKPGQYVWDCCRSCFWRFKKKYGFLLLTLSHSFWSIGSENVPVSVCDIMFVTIWLVFMFHNFQWQRYKSSIWTGRLEKTSKKRLFYYHDSSVQLTFSVS